jgi:CHASE3 domain sensor protein
MNTKIREMKISKQLNIGLGTILLIIILLAASSLYSIEILWSNTAGLYEHPFAVRRAIGAMNSDVLSIHKDMWQLVSEESQQVKDSLIIKMEDFEYDISQQFSVLYEKYLGDKSDIDMVFDALLHWKTIRSETIRLIRDGKISDARDRIKAGGIGGEQADIILSHIKKISDFSMDKSEEFYTSAQKQRNQNIFLLITLLCIISLGLLYINYFLKKGILPPLKELTTATGAMRHGNLGIRSHYESLNEFGVLSSSFNEMAASLQTEIRHKDNIAKVSQVMFQNESLRPFCSELLKILIILTNSQTGAVYILNENNNHFEHFESIGLSKENLRSFSAIEQEGEFGLGTTPVRYSI